MLGIFIGYAATPTIQMHLTGGPYPGAPTYSITREGSNYFAKDKYGAIGYSGTNASDVIIPTMANNSMTFLSPGTYYLTHTLTATKLYNYTLRGSGTSSILKMTTNKTVIAINGTSGNHLQYITLESFFIEGYHPSAYATDKSNIQFYYVDRSNIQDITMYSGCGNGIKLDHSNTVQITNVKTTDLMGNGIWMLSCADNTVSNAKIWGCFGYGLFLQSTGGVTIDGSEFDTSVRHNVVLYDATHCTITGCNIYDFDYLDQQTWNGISMAGSSPGATTDNLIDGCLIHNPYSAGKYCIDISSDCNRTIIDAVNCVGLTTGNNQLAGIVDNGLHTHVSNSWNITAADLPVWIATYP